MKNFGGHDIEFVRVPHSSSDKSFNNTKSRVDEALKYNGLTHGGTFESAFRVSNHLCRFYRDSFVAAMEKQGLVHRRTGLPSMQAVTTHPNCQNGSELTETITRSF